uniref:Putative secreted protein n=1 Tax=Anopheles darlingi TaxID=43151 RepID=A0A2M4DJU7_ANODA
MVLPDNSHSTLNTKLRLLSVAILCVLFSWKWALPFKVNPQTGLVIVNTIHKLTTKHVSWPKGMRPLGTSPGFGSFRIGRIL